MIKRPNNLDTHTQKNGKVPNNHPTACTSSFGEKTLSELNSVTEILTNSKRKYSLVQMLWLATNNNKIL